MADRPLANPLPADLPENWTSGQIVAPMGADVGLSAQHGYNYLMAAVNAAQRALNTINESFDTISGKRTCRVTVGTSTAGWTQADCDFLCDGTNDQEKIEEALNSLPAGGGEIVFLDGTYHVPQAVFAEIDGSKSVVLSGNGPATVLSGSESYFEAYGGPGTFILRDLSLDGVGVEIQSLDARVSGCSFKNSGLNIFTHETGRVEVSGNSFFYDANGAGSNSISVTCGSEEESVAVISQNRLRAAVSGWYGISCTLGVQLVSGNTIDGAFEQGVLHGAAGSVAGNTLTGCNLISSDAPVWQNFVKDGGIDARKLAESTSGSPMLVLGNTVRNGGIAVTDWAVVSNNAISASAGTPCVHAARQSTRSLEKLSPIVSGNTCGGGTYGVHFALPDGLPASYQWKENALVTGNQFFGQSGCSVQIESTWRKCMVTDNILDSPVVDNGTDNIVRLNSDDAGSGGSGGTAGVSSFKGRSGAVVPQSGDYTAAMVEAIPAGDVTAIRKMTQAAYDALAAKDANTFYVIEG